MSSPESGELKRSLGLFAVISLGINGVIGQGIFLVPGKAAGLMGPSALVALALGGVVCFCIALCFAEVGSRFQGTGGAYLYAREAFGDFVGFEVGWMTCCVAVIAWAALANGFTVVLSRFIPAVGEGWVQPAIAGGLVTVLSAVNLLGARQGARVVNFFTVAKLIPIALFITVGAFFVEGGNFQPFAPHGAAPLAETTLLLMYAYVGFETMVVPAGEMDDPQRSVPLALFAVLAICSFVYLTVFAVATGTYPGIAGSTNPVAEASELFLGGWGATLIGIGICLSVFGTNAGSALVSPRRFYALGERGDLPEWVAWVSPKTGAPVPAIVITWIAALGLTVSGTFEELAVLSVLARFVQYIPTCVAVLVLRKRDGDVPHEGYRIPFGPVIPILTLLLCGWLLVNTAPERLIKGSVALVIGVPLYFLSRWYRTRSGNRDGNGNGRSVSATSHEHDHDWRARPR